MKADIIFTTHDQEAIEQAEQLGMDKPEPTEEKGELYFKLELIDVAYLNDSGAIIIYLPSGSWNLEYNESLWEKIKKHLNDQ